LAADFGQMTVFLGHDRLVPSLKQTPGSAVAVVECRDNERKSIFRDETGHLIDSTGILYTKRPKHDTYTIAQNIANSKLKVVLSI
jgi:hypothetical protein